MGKKAVVLLLLFTAVAVLASGYFFLRGQARTPDPEKVTALKDTYRKALDALVESIGGGHEREEEIINPEGNTIEERFKTPPGFERVAVESGSFGEYLRKLPLKAHGTRVRYFNGDIKPWNVHEAVIDMDVGNRDLQQCADAVMRLWAEYLYGKKLYDKICFSFVSGFQADYRTWMEGNRIVVENGTKAYWVKKTGYADDYGSFRRYMDMVFAYAGTQSLERDMERAPFKDMRIGDVLLKGGLPGHCVIVVDMAENPLTGEKLFMLAQSYMPAQDIHILKNPDDESLSPWYRLDSGEKILTPEWQFTKDQLYRFRD